MCVCVCVRACMCVCACVHACVRVCVLSANQFHSFEARQLKLCSKIFSPIYTGWVLGHVSLPNIYWVGLGCVSLPNK